MTEMELYTEIQKFCKANADPELVKKYSRYFTEGYDAYGIKDKLLTDKAASLLNSSIDISIVLAASRTLVESGKYEETYFAVLLLKSFVAGFTSDIFDEISAWFDIGIVNWAHCDVVCRDIITTMLEKKLIYLQSFSDWRTGKNTYKRRAVPVSMLTLLPVQRDYGELFDFIEPLMIDTEKKVQQGLGWFLREAWKINKDDTEAFLLKWKNDAPRVIYQYATEKMTADSKKRFRKEKPKKTARK